MVRNNDSIHSLFIIGTQNQVNGHRCGSVINLLQNIIYDEKILTFDCRKIVVQFGTIWALFWNSNGDTYDIRFFSEEKTQTKVSIRSPFRQVDGFMWEIMLSHYLFSSFTSGYSLNEISTWVHIILVWEKKLPESERREIKLMKEIINQSIIQFHSDCRRLRSTNQHQVSLVKLCFWGYIWLAVCFYMYSTRYLCDVRYVACRKSIAVIEMCSLLMKCEMLRPQKSYVVTELYLENPFTCLSRFMIVHQSVRHLHCLSHSFLFSQSLFLTAAPFKVTNLLVKF